MSFRFAHIDPEYIDSYVMLSMFDHKATEATDSGDQPKKARKVSYAVLSEYINMLQL